MKAVHTLHGFSVLLASLQAVGDVDPTDHEHTPLLLHLPTHVGRQSPATCIDPARLQRASEGPGQSTAGSGDDIIERSRNITLGLDTVMLFNCAVNSELHRPFMSRQPSVTEGSFDTVDPDIC